MKTITFVVVLILLAGTGPVRAQENSSDLTNQSEPNDRTREAMFNLQNPTAALTSGGAFYVSNPSAAYEVDAEKAYLNAKFTSFSVILQGGQEYTLPARIRLVDQRVEVVVEGEVYELDSPTIQAVIDPEGRVFIPAFDPIGRTKGLQWYEVAFAGKAGRLLVFEGTVWQDPPQKNMFDTSEPRKTLKRVTRYYFITPAGNVEIDNMKDLTNELEESKEGAQYVRQERLKNNLEDYVALLQYLEGRE